MRLMIFGYGYTARFVYASAQRTGLSVIATSRNLKTADIPLIHPDDVAAHISDCTHVLVTAPPANGVCPALALLAGHIPAQMWVGYLSTTGVYGDHQGGWVDENTPPNPQSPEAKARLAAEQGWQAATSPCAIFRLPAIYGPKRSPFERVQSGAPAIIKTEQIFSRIHVEDIATAVVAAMRARKGGLYNLADDEPAPPEDVLDEAARMIGLPPPPRVTWDDPSVSPMTRRFYSECKRVRNDKMKRDLGVVLKYPTYREGLEAILRTPSTAAVMR